jgi:hypothetical protein
MTTATTALRSLPHRLLLLVCLAAAFAWATGCASTPAPVDEAPVAEVEAHGDDEHDDHGDGHHHDHDEDKGDGGYIGDAEGPFERGAAMSIPEDEAIALAEIVADPAAFADRVVRIEGTASSVCERRGCWFVIEAEGVEEPVRVRFVDYAFFIPKDAAGRAVSLEASVEVRTLTPERQVHYAEHVGETLDEEGLEDRDEVTLIARALVVY